MNKQLLEIRDKLVAEEATGIVENSRGLGLFYADADTVLTPAQAYSLLREGGSVELPNAGAGSYWSFFQACGFVNVESFDTCSSAGDWTFILQDGPEGWWYIACQSNRWPRAGFSYSLNLDLCAETQNELMHLVNLYVGRS